MLYYKLRQILHTFVQILNNGGPKIVPWGMPDITCKFR